jgi:PAS domain S-box-containing protein
MWWAAILIGGGFAASPNGYPPAFRGSPMWDWEHVLIDATTVLVIIVGVLFWGFRLSWQTRRQAAVAQRELEEQRKTEFALRESERRLATLLGNLPGMAYRCRNDAAWSMEFVSDGCRELTGYQAADVVYNRKVAYGDLILPDDRGQVWDGVQAAVRERRPFKLVYRIRAADAQEKYVWEQGCGVFSAEGDLVALEGFITDITEQMKLVALLQASEAKYRAIFDGVNDAILIRDIRTGQILEVNHKMTEMYGYTRDEACQMSIGELSAGEPGYTNEDALRIVGEVRERNEARRFEWRARSKTGHVFWIDVNIARISLDGQERLVAIVRDIDQRKRIEAELERHRHHLEEMVRERTSLAEHRASQLRLLAAEVTQAEERERHRIARILHDQLQQILVAARLKASVLRRRVHGDSLLPTVEQLDDLLSEAIRESQSLTVSLSPPVLYDRGLIGGLEWLARQTQESHGLTVHLTADARAEPAELDTRILLFQAVRELLLNVVKHAQASHASVELRQCDKECLHLVVADDGVGFNPATPSTGGSANGFGLFSIRERLELIGGRLAVESAPGSGTRVTIETPVELPEALGSE